MRDTNYINSILPVTKAGFLIHHTQKKMSLSQN
jgi:hypothetical protein